MENKLEEQLLNTQRELKLLWLLLPLYPELQQKIMDLIEELNNQKWQNSN